MARRDTRDLFKKILGKVAPKSVGQPSEIFEDLASAKNTVGDHNANRASTSQPETPSTKTTPVAGSHTTANDELTQVEPSTRNLWQEAYDVLSTDQEKAKLLTAFTSRVLGEDPERDLASNPVTKEELYGILQARGIEAEHARSKSGRLAQRTQDAFNKVVKTIDFAKDFITLAASFEPHATAAWAGVSLLLPVSIFRFSFAI